MDFANANKQDLNGFLLHHIAYYKDSGYNDTALQECIKEDFVGQIKETWAPANKDIVQDFHNFFQENRVFVPKNGGIIRDNIQGQVINIKEKHKQTPQDIKY